MLKKLLMTAIICTSISLPVFAMENQELTEAMPGQTRSPAPKPLGGNALKDYARATKAKPSHVDQEEDDRIAIGYGRQLAVLHYASKIIIPLSVAVISFVISYKLAQ